MTMLFISPVAAEDSKAEQASPQEKAQPVTQGEVLDLERCLNIALLNQPAIMAAKGAVFANQSRIGQAKANYYPTVDLTAGYSRTKSVPSANRPTVTSNNSFGLYSNSVELRQTIYDFGKTSAAVKVQQFNTDASRSDLQNTLEETVLSVKHAYYNLLQSKRNRDVAQETVKQFEQHLDQAKGFFDVGLKPRFDVIRAEVDLSNARVNLIKAENAVRLAKASLRNVMGISGAPDFEIEDVLSFEKYGITLDEALAKAFENRPDLKAAVLRRRSAEETIRLAKREYYPSLSGNAAYNWAGESYPLKEGWNAGVSVTIPVFTGFLSKYLLQEANANLDIARANENLAKQGVTFDVQQAYLNLKEAEERIPAAELAAKQAEENLDISNGRYATGVGNPIEVTDALVAYINAKTSYIQALSDYKIAQAGLERAMGEQVK